MEQSIMIADIDIEKLDLRSWKIAFDVAIVSGMPYVSHSSLEYGDYGGAGSVGVANVRVLKEQLGDFGYIKGQVEREYPGAEHGYPPLLIDTGWYGYEKAWVRADIAEEHIACLSDYPCLDDEAVSEVEMEWENGAWESWLLSDLLGLLDEHDREYAEDVPADVLYECYRQAMEETNTYPEPEYAGVYVDLDRIKWAWVAAVREELEARHVAR